MTKAQILLVLTIICGAAATLLGCASLAELLPPEYAAYVGTVSVGLLVAYRVAMKVGDVADDGVENDSFRPGSNEPVVKKTRKPMLPLVMGALALLCLASCAALQRASIPLAQLGLAVAAERGVIREGDRLLIGSGIAYLAEDGATTRDKIVRLKDLGLQAAVQRGALKQGDVVLIQQGSAIIEQAITPTAPAPVPPTTSL